MFIAGLGVGVFVTLMAFTVFVTKPAQLSATPHGPLTQPVEALQGAISRGEDPATAERDLLLNDADAPAEATINTPGQAKPQSGGFSFNFGQPKAQEPAPPQVLQPSEADELTPTPAAQANVYQVQAGDTLSTIAQRFYNSSHPDMVEKLQRANNLTDAHTLSLGQKLVIPPKAYR
jgi:nucleoid-associated protein YgaU